MSPCMGSDCTLNPSLTCELQAVYDETGRLVALGLGVIMLCLIQIYRGNRWAGHWRES